MEAAERLAAQLPDDGRVALEWARTLHAFADDPEAALVPIDRAVSLAPGLHSARFERALLRLQLDRPREALEDLEALRSVGVRHPELLHLHRARALEALGEDAEALEAWGAAIRAAPASAWLHGQHARQARRMGQMQEAAASLVQARAAAETAGEAPDPELLLDLAELRWELGESGRARDALQEASEALWEEETGLRARHEALSARLATEDT